MSDETTRSKIWEWVRWGATALVIPLLVWAWTLQSKVNESEHRVVELEKDLAAMESDIKSDNEKIREIELTVVRMEGKLDNANSTLEKIEALLRTP